MEGPKVDPFIWRRKCFLKTFKPYLTPFLLTFTKFETTSMHSLYWGPEGSLNNSATFNAECHHITEITIRMVDLPLG